MSALPDTSVMRIAAPPELSRSREEVAFQAWGKALESVRLAGERLVASFDELARQQDAITESRMGQVTPHFGLKAVDSAWATYRLETNALERQEERSPSGDVPGWVNT